MEHIQEKPAVKVTYFVPDETKEGGAYATIQGDIRKIDLYRGRITLVDGRWISIYDVSTIEIL